jgi:threonine aldolase
MRFVSAQMEAWLTDGLWLRLAGQANASADRLAEGIAATPGARLLHPVEANMLFAEIPHAAHRRLQAAGAKYYPWPSDQPEEGPDDAPLSVRLVCSHQTTAAEIDRFLEVLRDA